MKFDWNNWNTGGRIIFVASCAAVVSMFMNWVDIGIASQTGLSSGTVLLLGLYIYPVLKLFKNEPIHKTGGIACAAISVACAIFYINAQSIGFFGHSVNAAAGGAWLFLIASGGLVAGVIQYKTLAQGVVTEGKSCVSCGAATTEADRFCSECGQKTR